MKKGRAAKTAAKDVNALAFEPEKQQRDPLAKHFIPREGARNKSLEITFDPTKHKCAAAAAAAHAATPLPMRPQSTPCAGSG